MVEVYIFMFFDNFFGIHDPLAGKIPNFEFSGIRKYFPYLLRIQKNITLLWVPYIISVQISVF